MLVVVDNGSNGAGLLGVENLLGEVVAAALDHSDLAFHVETLKVGGFAVIGDHHIAKAVLFTQHIDHGQFRNIGGVVISHAHGLAFNFHLCHIGVESRVFYGSHGQVAVIGGRRAHGAVVGVVGGHIACAGQVGGAVSLGAFVARCDHAHNAVIFQSLVDVAEHFALQLGIIGEAVLGTQRHVDHVRAQVHGVFQRCKVDVGRGAALAVEEDLHGQDLRVGGSAHKGDFAFLGHRITGGNAGNVGAVTVAVVDVVVAVGVVIGERNLLGNIGAVTDLFHISLGVSLADGGALQPALVDLECLVVDVQAGIDHGDHRAGTHHAGIVHQVGAGHFVGRIHVDGIVGQRIAVCDMNCLDAAHGSDLVQIAIGHTDGHTVEQSVILKLHSVVNPGSSHCLAQLCVLVGQGGLNRCSLACFDFRRGAAVHQDDGANDFVICVLIGVARGESVALKAALFRTSGLDLCHGSGGSFLCHGRNGQAGQSQCQDKNDCQQSFYVLHVLSPFSENFYR